LKSLKQKTNRYIFIGILFSLLITNSFAAASAPSAACKSAVGTDSMIKVLTNTLKTLYNVFPLKIATVEIIPPYGENSDDPYETVGTPICLCPTPYPPYIRIGITVSFWEPFAITEPSNIPNCSAAYGLHLPINIVGGNSFQSQAKGNTNHTESYQVTHSRYPIFKLLGMLIDFVCLAGDDSMDIVYMTTIDPLWQNDMWSAILNPEVFLLSNPIAQVACTVDAIAATVSHPIDALWWCFGAWNGTFPLTANTKGVDTPQTAAGMTARMLAKLHRQLMLNNTVGPAAMCNPHPLPFMPKTNYGIFPVFPRMVYPYRIPIGKSGHLWGTFSDIPMDNRHVWSWAIYRKRDCCAF